MRTGLAAAALVCTVGGAFAQPAPQTLPSRDVTVVYRPEGAARDMVPGGMPGDLRVAWSASSQRLRVEPLGRAQALLVDLGSASVELIDRGLHSAMSLPVRAQDLDPVKLQDARLTRQGGAVVAGLPCTDYAVQARRGHGTVCLTADGVALRASGEVDGKPGSFTAVSVDRTPLSPGMFDVPRDFMRLSLPRLPR